MAGAPSAQLRSELGGPEIDLLEELPGHLHAPWEPLGLEELPIEVGRDSLRVHPMLLLEVQ